MDDLGTIIYVVLIVISIVSGLWKNISKQRKASAEPGAPADVFEQEQPTRQTTNYESQFEFEQSVMKPVSKTAVEIRDERHKKDKEEESHQEVLLDEEPFDVRKAIIYSEILNPPYL